MIRSILIHPDPRLKKVCDPVTEITPDLRKLAEDIESLEQECTVEVAGQIADGGNLVAGDLQLHAAACGVVPAGNSKTTGGAHRRGKPCETAFRMPTGWQPVS